MSLQKLPNEIVALVTRDLAIEDIFHLALTCSQFREVIYDDTIAKHALEVRYIPSSCRQTAPRVIDFLFDR